VTAHLELDIGQELSIAHLARNMDKIMLLRRKLADCRTIAAKETAQNALCLAKAKAGYYVKAITAYLGPV